MGKASIESKTRIARRRAARADGEPLTVAIVGTGIAGETAAYLFSHSPSSKWSLQRVYEARSAPGLHANSIELDGHHVDVPLRAVSPHYYANLFQLYKHLGVEMQAVDYSTSTSRFHPSGASSQVSTVPTFRYQNALLFGWALPLLVWGDLLCWSKVRAMFLIVRDFMFLIATGPYLLREGVLEDIAALVQRVKQAPATETAVAALTFGELLRHLGYSATFMDAFLYPMLSTLLSCSYAQVDSYPAMYILEFFCSRSTTFFTGWFRVRSGVQEVSNKLLDQLGEGVLSLNNPVRSVHYCATSDMVCVTEQSGQQEWYDVVILATEPSVARRLWTQRTPCEEALMASLQHYDANITVHTDPMLLPSERPQWRGMNVFRHESTKDDGPLAASMTSARLAHYHKDLNTSLSNSPLLGKSTSSGFGGSSTTLSPEKNVTAPTSARMPPAEIIETWNCFQPPAEGCVLHDIRMTRAVWSGESKSVYDRWFQSVQGTRGVYLAGSYTEPGVTLLEQAVTSALRIGNDLGVPQPFPTRPCYEQSSAVVVCSSVFFCVWKFLRALVIVLFSVTLEPLWVACRLRPGVASSKK